MGKEEGKKNQGNGSDLKNVIETNLANEIQQIKQKNILAHLKELRTQSVKDTKNVVSPGQIKNGFDPLRKQGEVEPLTNRTNLPEKEKNKVRK